ncbi:hypothetical protein NDI45_28040 [Leptolyngbya sp. GB1-A1]|uniref:hypothetical protein n=1 Tax=Leptolyngbya sp. GB1-A1 TaxID=2933908 RepID=UPI00329997F3
MPIGLIRLIKFKCIGTARTVAGWMTLFEQGIDNLVSESAIAVGISKKRSPRRSRHSGIVEALSLTDGNVRAVQKLSRQKNIQTLMLHDNSQLPYAEGHQRQAHSRALECLLNGRMRVSDCYDRENAGFSLESFALQFQC